MIEALRPTFQALPQPPEPTEAEQAYINKDKAVGRVASREDFKVLITRWEKKLEEFKTGANLHPDKLTDTELGQAMRAELVVAEFITQELSFIDQCKKSLEGDEEDGET